MKLWLWRNGDHFWAFDNEHPCDAGGDPMTLGEPVGYALVKQSFGRATSEELFAALGSADPAKDARAVEAIVRRGDLRSVVDKD